MSDLVERVARAIKSVWDAQMTAEAEASDGLMDYEPGPWEEWVPEAEAALAAMRTDAELVADRQMTAKPVDDSGSGNTAIKPPLKPAVEVWRDAADASNSPVPCDDADCLHCLAAAAVIEADRAAIIAAKDAQIAALQAHADAMAKELEKSREGWANVLEFDLLPIQHESTALALEEGAHAALRAYQEFRR